MVDGAHITVVTVKMHLSFVQVSSQPRPYGFSLKKKKKKQWVVHVTGRCQGLFPPQPFFKGKAFGTRLVSSDRKQVSVLSGFHY